MSFLKYHARGLTLLLILGIGIIVALPYANFQNFLSQGDHGRDLYAAQAVYRGELPYRDFWWVYGPLMPYYYGLFFKIFGTTVSSMILGKLVLKTIGGILIGLAMMEVASGLAALLCACWFMLFQQDFFFTYNHIGGIVMVLGVAFCLLSYIKSNALKAAWGALGFVLALCLIKINFGIAALAITLITIGVCDTARQLKVNAEKKLFYIIALLGLPFLIFTIYWSLLKGLSVMEMRQCLPYMEGDQPYTMNAWTAIGLFAQNTLRTIISNPWNFMFAVIINGSLIGCVYLFVKNKLPPARRMILLLSLSMLGLFYVLNFHEYLKSGVWYRGFWAQPLGMMLTFLVIDIATQEIPKMARNIIFIFLSVLAFYCWILGLNQIHAFKNKNQFLNLPRGQVYLMNAPVWIETVEQTTDFLNRTLKPNELFFALPYDCLYYYLTDKKSPTRQLIFFEHIKIPMDQEKSIIADLERNHVNYIVMSNRAFARQELGLGFLGSTYCPLIGKYIQEHFSPIARFGNWTDEPGWAWNHGTLIFRRKGL